MDHIFGNTFLDPNPIELSKTPNFQSLVGPFLVFQGLKDKVYSVSILVICKQRVKIMVENSERSFTILYTFHDYNFNRCILHFPLEAQHQRIKYCINLDENIREYSFVLPAENENFKLAYYSCAGLSQGVDSLKYGGYCNLWFDLLKQSESEHLHLLVGGGDQLYNDAVFDIPSLSIWRHLKSRKERIEFVVDEEISEEICNFYFQHYCQHFMRDGIRNIFSTIPSLNAWDDHDIFNGYGSYPSDLQNCSVFQALFKAAETFYYLFQHHSLKGDGRFLYDSAFTSLLGPNLAILTLDTRTNRNLEQIIPANVYRNVFNQLELYPNTLKHLIIVIGVPLIFPSLKWEENTLNLVANINKFVNFSFDSLLQPFGEPELLNDIIDHWNTKTHEAEKDLFISYILNYAKKSSVRVTLLSGDSHCCGVGEIYTKTDDVTFNHSECDPKFLRHKKYKVSPKRDPSFVTQIISSAITNEPPPKIAMIPLHLARNHKKKSTYVEAMVKCFTQDVSKVSIDKDGVLTETDKSRLPPFKYLMPRRNYLLLKYMEDGINASFQIEKEIDYSKVSLTTDTRKFRTCESFPIYIPHLQIN
eukprot:NODE_249_length_11770_cov_0.803530.p3 type:complete len:587 gc:universal NODE_249_length_11770_cov_0.803530:11689-9929(-)